MQHSADYKTDERHFRLLVFQNEDGWRYRVREVGLGGFDNHKPADCWERGLSEAQRRLEYLVGHPVELAWRIES
jgi:hypothetical protein